MKRFCYNDLPRAHDDPEWWAEEHRMELQVTGLEGENETRHNMNLSVYLDEEHLFNWTFESETENTDENKRKINA